MKKYFLFTLSAVMVLTLFTASAYNAQTKEKQIKHMTHMDTLKHLNLTKDQKDKVEKFRYEHRKEVTDLRYEMQKNRIEIDELLKNTNLDENKIRSLVDKNSDLQARIKKSGLDLWFKTYNVLDDKQKETWREESPLLNGGGIRHMMMHDGDGTGIRQKIIRKFRHETGQIEQEQGPDQDLDIVMHEEMEQ